MSRLNLDESEVFASYFEIISKNKSLANAEKVYPDFDLLNTAATEFDGITALASADNTLYGLPGETGEQTVAKAHPGGGTNLDLGSNSKELGKVETVVETQKKVRDVAESKPTGKLAAALQRLVALANKMDAQGEFELAADLDDALGKLAATLPVRREVGNPKPAVKADDADVFKGIPDPKVKLDPGGPNMGTRSGPVPPANKSVAANTKMAIEKTSRDHEFGMSFKPDHSLITEKLNPGDDFTMEMGEPTVTDALGPGDDFTMEMGEPTVTDVVKPPHTRVDKKGSGLKRDISKTSRDHEFGMSFKPDHSLITEKLNPGDDFTMEMGEPTVTDAGGAPVKKLGPGDDFTMEMGEPTVTDVVKPPHTRVDKKGSGLKHDISKTSRDHEFGMSFKPDHSLITEENRPERDLQMSPARLHVTEDERQMNQVAESGARALKIYNLNNRVLELLNEIIQKHGGEGGTFDITGKINAGARDMLRQLGVPDKPKNWQEIFVPLKNAAHTTGRTKESLVNELIPGEDSGNLHDNSPKPGGWQGIPDMRERLRSLRRPNDPSTGTKSGPNPTRLRWDETAPPRS